jgi:pimeloyl-ACP methyl ester carboxylesterase
MFAVRAVRALQWEEPFVVVGHSLGGAIGAMLCAAFPELVSAFVSIDMVGIMSKSPSQTAGMAPFCGQQALGFSKQAVSFFPEYNP